MKTCGTVLLVLMGTLFSCTKNETKPARPEFARISWLLGSWEGRDSNQFLFENWRRVQDELFKGEAFITIQNDTVFHELVTIEIKDSVLVYRVVVGQNPPVDFKLVIADEQTVSFSNPQHDFPQNITYKLRSDGSLYAYVDGMIGKQYRKEEFIYTKKQE